MYKKVIVFGLLILIISLALHSKAHLEFKDLENAWAQEYVFGFGNIYAIKYSTDCSNFAVASGSIVQIYDTNTYELQTQLLTHKNIVRDVAYSPDSNYVITGSEDGTAKLFSVISGEEIKHCLPTVDIVCSVAWSVENKIALGLGKSEKHVKLLDNELNIINKLKKFEDSIPDIEFSENGKKLAVSSGIYEYYYTDDMNYDTRIGIFDDDGNLLGYLTGHTDAVFAVRWFKHKLASASNDKTIKIWNTETYECICTLKPESSDKNLAIYDVVWVNDNEIISAVENGTINLWNLETKKIIKTYDFKYPVKALALHNNILLVGYCKRVTVFDIKSWNEKFTINYHTEDVYSTDFSLDGKKIVSVSYDRTIKLWSTEYYECLRTIQWESRLRTVDYSPKGTKFVTGDNNGIIGLWTSEGSYIKSIQEYTLSSGYIYDLEFSHNGAVFASASEDMNGYYGVKIWTETGELKYILKGHKSTVRCVSFSPDDKKLVSGSDDGTLMIWDVEKGTNIQTIIIPELQTVYTLKWLPNNLIVIGLYGGLLVYNSDGKYVTNLAPFSGWATTITSSSDGSKVAVSHYYGFSVFNVTTSKLISNNIFAPWQENTVRTICWQENKILCCGRDGTVRIFKPQIQIGVTTNHKVLSENNIILKVHIHHYELPIDNAKITISSKIKELSTYTDSLGNAEIEFNVGSVTENQTLNLEIKAEKPDAPDVLYAPGKKLLKYELYPKEIYIYVNAPEKLYSCEKTIIKVELRNALTELKNSMLQFEVSKGALKLLHTDLDKGIYEFEYTAPKDVKHLTTEIKFTASSPNYTTAQTTVKINILPPYKISQMEVYYTAAIILLIFISLWLFIKYKKRNKS